MMVAIQLRNVSKSFDDRRALHNVDLEVDDGEYLVVLGPTGAGKTTLLKVVAGLEKPNEGSVFLSGRDVTNVPPEERRVAYVPQTYSLFPHMSVWDNVVFGPRVKDWNPQLIDGTAREMLSLVRLIDRRDAFPRELSGGMQQRCALARALSANAQILLLDEPLRALDARLRINLRNELRSLSKHLGITTLHVTHDQDEAMMLADRIVLLRKGQVWEVGRPEDVYRRPAHPFTANFLGESNFLEGVLRQLDAQACLIEGEGGRVLRGRPDTGLAPGSKVLLAVKIENCRLLRGRAQGLNHIPGIVKRRLFHGKWITFEVECGLERTMKARIPWVLGRDLAEGSEVTVSFNTDDVQVYAWPSEPLQQLLEVG